MAEWTPLGKALDELAEKWFDADELSIYQASKQRTIENQAALRRGEPAPNPTPLGYLDDGSELHDDGRPGYLCYICHDAGFVRREVAISHPDFGKAHLCPHRTSDGSLERERMQTRLAKNGLPAPLKESTLVAFKPLRGAHEGHSQALQFIRDLRAGNTPKWLLLTGGPGHGKTHLLAGITIACCVEAQTQALYYDVRNLLIACKALNFQADERLTKEANEVPVLVFDEFLSQYDREWGQDKLEAILTTRWEHQRPTVVATSQPLDVLQEWSPRLFSRFGDRVLSRIIELSAGDYRQRTER